LPRNGSGTYTAPANSFNPAVPATTIASADFNTLLADMETGLSESIARDGQTATTAAIPFAGGGIKTDIIAENGANNGVTVDGLLIKDGGIADDVAFTQQVLLTGIISPSQITANQDDYNPTGLSTASVLRLNTDASRNITSLQGGASGRLLIVENVGSFNIVLTDDDGATGTAANRFDLANNITLLPSEVAVIKYDSTTQRWRQLAGPVGGAITAKALTMTTANLLGRTTAGTGLIELIPFVVATTWTPVLRGSSTAGTQSYTTQVGRYIRIGPFVIAWFVLVMSLKDAATAGSMQIGGLPLASINVSGLTFSSVISDHAVIDLTANYTQLGIGVDTNASTATLLQSGDNQAVSTVQAAAISNTSAVSGVLIYLTA